jgi:hypothetical protein
VDGEHINLHLGAIQLSDALIEGSAELSDKDKAMMTDSGKPILAHQEEDKFKAEYVDFYHSLLEEEVES